MSTLSRPALFLDRDGTLIEERSYLTRPEQVVLLPGAGTALQQLRLAGFACVVVTNQSGVGRGLLTEAELELVHEEMRTQLRAEGTEIDGLYFCPLAPTSSDKTVVEHPDRKPGPGMLLRAARELNIDLSRSWMVGDSVCDVLAGHNAGCRGSILVRSGHPVATALAHLGVRDQVVDDLVAATRLILATHDPAATAA